jgi:4-aminobutyrate aminotransferase-like enzyme
MSICRMAPPLTIGDDELDRGIEIMDEALGIASEATTAASGAPR